MAKKKTNFQKGKRVKTTREMVEFALRKKPGTNEWENRGEKGNKEFIKKFNCKKFDNIQGGNIGANFSKDLDSSKYKLPSKFTKNKILKTPKVSHATPSGAAGRPLSNRTIKSSSSSLDSILLEVKSLSEKDRTVVKKWIELLG